MKRDAHTDKNRVLNHSSQTTDSPDLTITDSASIIVATVVGGKVEKAIAKGTIEADGRIAPPRKNQSH
jgi:hypothetical protein